MFAWRRIFCATDGCTFARESKVTKVADFGALVEIEPGNRGPRPRQRASRRARGELDPHERKVALSVKAALREGEDYREYML